MAINQSFNQSATGDGIVDQGAANTAANAWPHKLTDGTNTAAVKAASTAPLATDPAAVVTLSPNGNQATAALQTTGNTSLANIDAGIPTALGAVAAANSMPVVDILTTGAQYRAQSVTTSAALALGGSSALTDRKMLHITPTNGTIYWGYNSSVTTTTGTPLFTNQTLYLSIGTGVTVYVISATTTDARIAELS